jgi:hypothetical protein
MKRRRHLYQALQKGLLRLPRGQPQFLPNFVRLEIFLRVKMRDAARKSPFVFRLHIPQMYSAAAVRRLPARRAAIIAAFEPATPPPQEAQITTDIFLETGYSLFAA